MGNGTQMTTGEKKISSQLAFNSFMTGVNVYTNMKINKSIQKNSLASLSTSSRYSASSTGSAGSAESDLR